jgi:ribosome maturation protein SDO1
VQYAARAYGSIKSFGQIRKEEWRADGSWFGIIEMSAGAYASFLNKLGHITKGNGQTKIIN